MRRRELLVGASAFALGLGAGVSLAQASDDPLSTIRSLIARAQRGESYAKLLLSADASDFFVSDAAAHTTAPPDFDVLAGAAGAPPPRLLAMRLLRRYRDQAFAQAALRERGLRGRVWTVMFVLRRNANIWRIESATAAFERNWLSRIAPRL